MLRLLYPFEYVDNVFSIDYKKLYELGYRGIMFDIDNTLTHHGEGSTKEVDNLFENIHSIGFKTVLLTDNDEARVKRFIKNIDTLYVCDAEKPKVDGFLKALKMLKIKKETVIYVGDQIFTDIYGANKVGIDNILVKYMRYETETKIGKKRKLENIILKLYLKNKKFQHRLGNICLKR